MGLMKTIAVVLLIIIAIIFGIRMLTPEDTWVCENGTWQMHGHPNQAMPSAICEPNK